MSQVEENWNYNNLETRTNWNENLGLSKYNKQKKILGETEKLLNTEAIITEAKTELYEKLWINKNMNSNSNFENFSKWIIDELLSNWEMALEVINTWWKIIIDALKQLATWEWLKTLAKELKESIFDLFVWNSYEKWKSVAVILPMIIWVWLSVTVWKKWLKLWMKNISKRRVHKENLVSSPDVKDVIWKVNSKVDDIIPKKQFDFEWSIVEDIAKLWDIDRLEAWSFYLKWKKFTHLEEKAILKAHDIWKDRIWAWIGKYNFTELKQKYIILKKAGFEEADIRILMEKWVCGKIANKPSMNNFNYDKLDPLDMDWWKFNWLKPIEFSRKIESFAEQINIKYLIDNPARVDNVLDIVEDMCDYIKNNANKILILNKNQVIDFKFGFNELMKKIDILVDNKNLPIKSRFDINEVKNNSIVKAYYNLNPTLAPKI